MREFKPGHPFLDAKSAPANAAFAAYLLYWALTTGYAVEQARKKLAAEPSLNSGLLFELYMLWLNGGVSSTPKPPSVAIPIALDDVGLLYEALASQSTAGQRATLEVTGEIDDKEVVVEFGIFSAGSNNEKTTTSEREYGPFNSDVRNGILRIRDSISGVRVVAPIAMAIGDGKTVKIIAPTEIDVDILEINGRNLRIVRPLGQSDDEAQVLLFSKEAIFNQLDSVVVAGGHLSASFPNVQVYPWSQYAVATPPAPNRKIAELRRRLRKVLTAFQAKGYSSGLVRLVAKIRNPRTIGQSDLGRLLVDQLIRDDILTEFDSGRFYRLDKERLSACLGMSYGDLQRQQWTQRSDNYLGTIG